MTNAEFRRRLRDLEWNPSGRRVWGVAYAPVTFSYPWFTYAEAALVAKLAEWGIAASDPVGDVPDEAMREALTAFGVAANSWVQEKKAMDR